MQCLNEQLFGAAFFNDLTKIHYCNFIRNMLNNSHIMCDKHICKIFFSLQIFEKV